MVHRGVRRDTHAQNAPRGRSGGFAHHADERQERFLHDRVLKPRDAARLLLLDDAVDDIRAVPNLPVAGGRFCLDLARFQVQQHARDGRCADVDGAAVHRLLVCGHIQHGQHIVLDQTRRENMEIPLAQRVRKLFDGGIAQLDILIALCLKRPLKALGVGHGVVQRRLVHRQLDLHERVFKRDARRADLFLQRAENFQLLRGGQIRRFHAALVRGRDVRHHDHYIRRDLARAAQPPALGVLLLGDVPGFRSVHRALQQLYAALTA